MGNVVFLSLLPGRFGYFNGIGASFHDLGNCETKSAANIFQSWLSTSIFHHVMQNGSDGFILVGSILKSNGGDTEKMGNVGNLGDFTLLRAMSLTCVGYRFGKAR